MKLPEPMELGLGCHAIRCRLQVESGHCAQPSDQAHRQVFSTLPFLGCIIHGIIHKHWYNILARQTHGHAFNPYFVVAPPAKAMGVGASWLDGGGGVAFDIVLAAPLNRYREQLQDALRHIDLLTAGVERYPVSNVQLAPLQVALSTQNRDTNWFDNQAQSCVELKWHTPMHLTSRRQIEAGFGHCPPSIYRVVRSLANRARYFAPNWADHLQLNHATWQSAAELLKQATRCPTALSTIEWACGSRTKARPFYRTGHVGKQSFITPLPPEVRALLEGGQWLGVGEGASYGCGRYTLQIHSPKRSEGNTKHEWDIFSATGHIAGRECAG